MSQFLIAARAMAARERLAKELGAVLDDGVEGRSGIVATLGDGRARGFGAIRLGTAAGTPRGLLGTSGDKIVYSAPLGSNPAIAKFPRLGSLSHICPSPGELG
jgi:hypothetical protein